MKSPADALHAETSGAMCGHSREYAAAGFWIRVAAVWLDVAILSTVVAVAKAVLARGNVYVPFELALILTLTVYNVVLVAWSGATLGKMLCGLSVRRVDGQYAGIGRALARETVGKFVSLASLLLGYAWVGFSRKKRGWHDIVTGTAVLRLVPRPKRVRLQMIAVLAVTVLGLGLYVHEMAGAYIIVKEMSPPPEAKLAYLERDPSSLAEVSSLRPEDDAEFLDWIESQGKDPIDYAVMKAQQHQVLIFGESHERKVELRYLNDLIPELHHRAGVTCVAMEVCLAEDNELIEKLVTASEFDHEAAMRIARRQPWGMWGWKGYWDVFETVWRINQEMPPGREEVRVIGLDRPMDMPSIGMLGMEDNAGRDTPIWERLRAWRLLLALPRVLTRDAFFAMHVENEIIRKGCRGIVWVGRNHSSIHSPQIVSPQRRFPRMGFMLRSRYGERVFQIRLHGHDIPVSAVKSDYRGAAPVMADFLERIMKGHGSEPVGFDVADSPFALLRDSGSLGYVSEPRLGFIDVASGHVFLAKRQDLALCDWLADYVSQEMFVTNKPFYQAFARRAGKDVNSAQEMNECFDLVGGEK